MTRSAHIALVAGLLALGAAGGGLAARGAWYEPYLDALEALDAGDAASALPLFEQALERKAESGYFRTYGTNFVRYAPHMQSARAHHVLGDCSAALAALERAESAGEIDAEPAFVPRADAIRAACAPPLAPADAPRDPADSAAAEAPAELPPEPPPPSVDEALFERGLVAYLAGDLQGASRLLERVAEGAPESAAAQLMLGTVLHASWSAGGESDEALYARALDALRRARALDPFLAPPPGICSPELRELHARAR